MDESHRIRFVYTSKHSSWVNQNRNLFGIIKSEAFEKQAAINP